MSLFREVVFHWSHGAPDSSNLEVPPPALMVLWCNWRHPCPHVPSASAADMVARVCASFSDCLGVLKLQTLNKYQVGNCEMIAFWPSWKQIVMLKLSATSSWISAVSGMLPMKSSILSQVAIRFRGVDRCRNHGQIAKITSEKKIK